MRFAFKTSDIWAYIVFAGILVCVLWLHPAKAADAQPLQVASADNTELAYNGTRSRPWSSRRGGAARTSRTCRSR